MSNLASVTSVKSVTATRRIRALTRSGDIVVPVGREVGPAHIVARGLAPAAHMVLRASEALQTPPETLPELLLVEEGATLKRGTPMLRVPRSYGKPKVYRAPADCTVIGVRDGYLVLRRTDMIEEVRALLKGKVVSIIPDRGVIIETLGSQIRAAWDSGKSGFGRLLAPAGSSNHRLSLADYGAEAAGSVCVASIVDRYEPLASLEERGARGLIAGSMPAELCVRSRELSFPIMLTEGVGRRPMAEPIFGLLKQSEGREISLLAESCVHRPQAAEIIIPLPTSGQQAQVEASDDSLKMGSLVRVAGLGDQTNLGRVAKLYGQPRQTAQGGMAAGADVVLADGRALFVPYANLDLIG